MLQFVISKLAPPRDVFFGGGGDHQMALKRVVVDSDRNRSGGAREK